MYASAQLLYIRLKPASLAIRFCCLSIVDCQNCLCHDIC